MSDKIDIKRVYESPDKGDGTRFLVERLWPRGIKKENLELEAWLKDIAPTTELRQWFSHEIEKWSEFQKRYIEELKNKKEALEPIHKALKKGKVTLLYSAKDEEHNSALVLKNYLLKNA